MRADPRARGERVDGADAAVVILIEVEEIVGGQAPETTAFGDGIEHVLGGDRMIVVEVVDAQGSLLDAMSRL